MVQFKRIRIALFPAILFRAKIFVCCEYFKCKLPSPKLIISCFTSILLSINLQLHDNFIGLNIFHYRVSTIILSYPKRGPYGDANYRGNCSGYIIRDLLMHFQPRNFLECFAGGGSGYDVARELGYTNSIHLDLNDRFGNFNILKDPLPIRADFVFSHPPYWNIIKYSGKGNVWGDSVQMIYPIFTITATLLTN